MNIKEQKQALEKKRSFYIRLFLVFMVIGAIFSLIASINGQNNILGYIGTVFFVLSLVCIVIAYQTGKKLLNL